ncbi:hypothetical protein AVEN_100410-1 [Araneus ventricosus]|uniref:Uncharacterized protein n=1 Tax=Araneus ventricosus TaxID=182803 RepID=A0A4Y2JV42_ARAVE|nr:hypothetical protein AVEN_100410-1 [Araneus ventricosus]
MKLQKRKKKAPLIAISHKNSTLSAQRDAISPSFQGLLKPTKNLNEYCGSTLHRRCTLFKWPEGWWDGCNILKKHLIGRSKEVDRDLSTVSTGSCNCV